MPSTPKLGSVRSLEVYLRAAILPRFMERLREIEDELAEHRVRLGRVYADLQRSCQGQPELFERRWHELAQRWSFDHVNELIEQHNEYYPIERDLPVDPRTGDFVAITGRSYRREPAGPEWILQRFPPALPG